MTFDGVDIKDFHTHCDDSQLFTTPSKDVEFVSIPGRSGDLTISKDRFSNLTKSVNCFIRENFKQNYSALMNFLYSVKGYGRIEYEAEPDIFMLGQFVDAIEPTTGVWLNYGAFTLTFNCKPQKYLKSGENAITINSSTVIINPSLMAAKPLLEVTGTGSITINSSTLTLATNTGTTFIDCDLEDAYEGTINRNPDLTVTGGFPVLVSENEVSYSGFTSVKIYPRWWKL